MGDAEALLADAARIWAKAQVVHEGPSWQGQPPARALVEQIAARPDCHDGLLALLGSPSQLVVAHALQALELLGSKALAALPDELCGRREQVTFQCGSFRTGMDLGGYARQIRKRARR
jgi:hypothetical protein